MECLLEGKGSSDLLEGVQGHLACPVGLVVLFQCVSGQRFPEVAAGGLAACRRPGKQVNAERGCHLCDDCKLVVDVLDPLRKEE